MHSSCRNHDRITDARCQSGEKICAVHMFHGHKQTRQEKPSKQNEDDSDEDEKRTTTRRRWYRLPSCWKLQNRRWETLTQRRHCCSRHSFTWNYVISLSDSAMQILYSSNWEKVIVSSTWLDSNNFSNRGGGGGTTLTSDNAQAIGGKPGARGCILGRLILQYPGHQLTVVFLFAMVLAWQYQFHNLNWLSSGWSGKRVSAIVSFAFSKPGGMTMPKSWQILIKSEGSGARTSSRNLRPLRRYF